MTFTVHVPALSRGVLLHLVLSTTLLAVAVVLGPPIAWLTGQSVVVIVLTVLAALTRAGVARWQARPLWQAGASLGMIMRTCLFSGLIGYSLVFVPLNLMGMVSGGVLQQSGVAALFALIIDITLMLVAITSGALTAAVPPKRRKTSRLLSAENLPVVQQIQEAFEENRRRHRQSI